MLPQLQIKSFRANGTIVFTPGLSDFKPITSTDSSLNPGLQLLYVRRYIPSVEFQKYVHNVLKMENYAPLGRSWSLWSQSTLTLNGRDHPPREHKKLSSQTLHLRVINLSHGIRKKSPYHH